MRELALNSVFLKNRIAELGLKQWWLAEQVGVDRKTVVRWVQGQVKSIQRENVGALAQILSCSIEDLTLDDPSLQLASVNEQKAAAQALLTSSLVEKLGPIGEWNVIESLLKATIVSDLPLNVLGELYNQLTVASWRQSKLDQAEVYNRKAEEIARSSGDKQVLAGALVSKANLQSWRGDSAASISTYRDVLELESFIEPKTLGSVHSNLGAVFYEADRFDEGRVHVLKSIEIFEANGKSTDISIAWCHLALLELRAGNVDRVSDPCEKSIVAAAQDDYRRGLAMGDLIRADVFARRGDSDSARTALQSGLDRFAKLGIEEGLNYEFAGRVSRLLGDRETALRYLERGLSLAKDFPYELRQLHTEMALAKKST